MHVVLNSFFLVLVSEMGDKTQLLALILASRFHRPWMIMAGIFCATLLNHALASSLGGWLGMHIPGEWQAWILAAIFFIFALWILVPDKDSEVKLESRYGAFLTTVTTFFLSEMGDKTQLATVALAAKYNSVLLVTMGTTAGMMVADGLAVFLGHRFTSRIPMKWVRIFAAMIFFLFGISILLMGGHQ